MIATHEESCHMSRLMCDKTRTHQGVLSCMSLEGVLSRMSLDLKESCHTWGVLSHVSTDVWQHSHTSRSLESWRSLVTYKYCTYIHMCICTHQGVLSCMSLEGVLSQMSLDLKESCHTWATHERVWPHMSLITYLKSRLIRDKTPTFVVTNESRFVTYLISTAHNIYTYMCT